MSAFPTTTANTQNVDEGTDSPKLARASFFTAFTLLNTIINSFNQALGICGLDAAGAVPSANLTGAVDNSAVQTNAIESGNILAGEINFNHLNATITNDPAAPTGGVDGDFHIIYE